MSDLFLVNDYRPINLKFLFTILYLFNKTYHNIVSSIGPINIRWIRTGSQTYRKIMYTIVLHTIFHEYENKTDDVDFIIFRLNIHGKLSNN